MDLAACALEIGECLGLVSVAKYWFLECVAGVTRPTQRESWRSRPVIDEAEKLRTSFWERRKLSGEQSKCLDFV